MTQMPKTADGLAAGVDVPSSLAADAEKARASARASGQKGEHASDWPRQKVRSAGARLITLAPVAPIGPPCANARARIDAGRGRGLTRGRSVTDRERTRSLAPRSFSPLRFPARLSAVQKISRSGLRRRAFCALAGVGPRASSSPAPSRCPPLLLAARAP